MDIYGLDMGSDGAKIARCAHGRPEIVRDEMGKTEFPTSAYVEDDGSITVGEKARLKGIRRPERFIVNAKRRSGTKQPLLGKGEPVVTSRDVAQAVYQEMYSNIERECNVRGRLNAIVTLPANFSDGAVREAKEAAKAACFDVQGIVREPTAGALFGLERSRFRPDRPFGVYDLGAGTFDVTFLQEEQDGRITALRTDGIRECGGHDLSRRLLELVLRKVSGKRASLDQLDVRERYDWSVACENAKRFLSIHDEIDVSLGTYQGSPVAPATITRSEYERAISDLVSQTLKLFSDTAKAAGLNVQGLRVVLIGGASRTPLVAKEIEDLTGEKPLFESPEHAVCLGAALFGAKKAERIKQGYLPAHANPVTEVLAHDIGLNVLIDQAGRHQFSPILRKGTPIPCSAHGSYGLSRADDVGAIVEVLQAPPGTFDSKNPPKPEDCHVLGRYEITGISPEKNAHTIDRIKVTVSMDTDTIAHFDVKDSIDGTSHQFECEYNPKKRGNK